MINGIYQSATGLSGLARIQESLAHNLANISTAGFKGEIVQLEQVRDGRIEAKAVLDLKAGPLQTSGNPTQLALGSEGYFVVETPQGLAYTRNGNFTLDAEGRLVTAEGYAVQGQNGAIVVSGKDFSVSELGEIVVNQAVVDRLQLVRGSQPLLPAGDSLLASATGVPLEAMDENQGQVLQGAVEGSNVNMMRSMVDMLAAVRLYEANQKALESQDETLKQAVSQIGRTA